MDAALEGTSGTSQTAICIAANRPGARRHGMWLAEVRMLQDEASNVAPDNRRRLRSRTRVAREIVAEPTLDVAQEPYWWRK